MPKVAVTFRDGRVLVTRSEEWEAIESGGEAEVYLFRLGGREYIAKVFSEKQTMVAKPVERMAEMLRRLSRLRRRCGGRLPASLVERALPLGFASLEGRAVLVFRSLTDFVTLADIISRQELTVKYLTEHDDAERAGFALDVLRGLACLEYADILHVDLTTANAAYGVSDGRPGVYLFDIEAAGIVGHPDYPLAVLPARDSYYMPVEVLSDLGLPLEAPGAEQLPLDLSPTRLPRGILAWIAWTPTWYGLQLVGYAYAAMSLFQGLPAMSAEHLGRLVEEERRKGYPGGWPPRSMVELGFLEMGEYRDLVKLWGQLGERFTSLVYQVFIVDVGEGRSAPSQTLSSIL